MKRFFSRGSKAEQVKGTMEQRLDEILSSANFSASDASDLDRLVQYAYWRGRESAAKELCDAATDRYNEQLERARACRYSHMAKAVVGEYRYFLESGDYDQVTLETFGDDPCRV